jgi:hypothetical protein
MMFSGAFLGFKAVETNAWIPMLFHSYFEDIIATPIVLFSALLFIRWIFPEHRSYRISTRQIIVVTTLFALHFELVMPAVSNRFVSDPIDILAYVIGSSLFWLIQSDGLIRNVRSEFARFERPQDKFLRFFE